MKPPFPYLGGKQTLAARIVDLLPAHSHYVEPYAGSLAVLLAKPPAQIETVNDLDRELMTFWRVLRDQPEALTAASALSPHSRAEYEAIRDRSCPPPQGDVEVARRVWVELTQGRAGRFAPTGWRYLIGPNTNSSIRRHIDSYLDRFPATVSRLRNVSLECRPALDVVATYGVEPTALLYVDPPYVTETRTSSGYRHEMTDADHCQLADALHAARAAVVLSGYPSDLYDRELYGDWDRVELAAWTQQGGGRGDRVEVLWSNRPLRRSADLFDFADMLTSDVRESPIGADGARQLGQGEAACPACGRPDVVDGSGAVAPHHVYGLTSPCECAVDPVRLAEGDTKASDLDSVPVEETPQ